MSQARGSTAHEALVDAQFGPAARAYVESTDHAEGDDLARIAALVAARPGARVLDVGCGGGHVTYAAAPHAGSVVACDLSDVMLAVVAAEARVRGFANVETRRGLAGALPFEDASFDIVATRFSAHHWPDLEAGLAEMRRVLKPDGLVVIADVIAPDAPLHDTFLKAIELLRDPSHVRDRSWREWARALRAVGLEPVRPSFGRLRLRFTPWIERIGTPELMASAARGLQLRMPAEVAAYFALEDDGSFTLDTMIVEAVPHGAAT